MVQSSAEVRRACLRRAKAPAVAAPRRSRGKRWRNQLATHLCRYLRWQAHREAVRYGSAQHIGRHERVLVRTRASRPALRRMHHGWSQINHAAASGLGDGFACVCCTVRDAYTFLQLPLASIVDLSHRFDCIPSIYSKEVKGQRASFIGQHVRWSDQHDSSTLRAYSRRSTHRPSQHGCAHANGVSDGELCCCCERVAPARARAPKLCGNSSGLGNPASPCCLGVERITAEQLLYYHRSGPYYDGCATRSLPRGWQGLLHCCRRPGRKVHEAAWHSTSGLALAAETADCRKKAHTVPEGCRAVESPRVDTRTWPCTCHRARQFLCTAARVHPSQGSRHAMGTGSKPPWPRYHRLPSSQCAPQCFQLLCKACCMWE